MFFLAESSPYCFINTLTGARYGSSPSVVCTRRVFRKRIKSRNACLRGRRTGVEWIRRLCAMSADVSRRQMSRGGRCRGESFRRKAGRNKRTLDGLCRIDETLRSTLWPYTLSFLNKKRERVADCKSSEIIWFYSRISDNIYNFNDGNQRETEKTLSRFLWARW